MTRRMLLGRLMADVDFILRRDRFGVSPRTGGGGWKRPAWVVSLLSDERDRMRRISRARRSRVDFDFFVGDVGGLEPLEVRTASAGMEAARECNEGRMGVIFEVEPTCA